MEGNSMGSIIGESKSAVVALAGILRIVMKDGDSSLTGKVIAWSIAIGAAVISAVGCLYFASFAIREELAAWMAFLGG